MLVSSATNSKSQKFVFKNFIYSALKTKLQNKCKVLSSLTFDLVDNCEVISVELMKIQVENPVLH